MFDAAAQYRALAPEIDAAVARVLGGKQYILGPEVEAFEAEFARFCGAAHAVGVGSGTDALQLALRACGVGAGDDVVTSASSSPFTALAIGMTGARPVFVDVDSRTYTMAPDAAALLAALPDPLRERLTERGRRHSPEETLDLVVEICRARESTAEDLALLLGRDRKYVMNDYLRPLLQAGRIQYTIPQQPRHPSQRYRATPESRP